MIMKGTVSRELIRNFQVCSKYFDVLTYFGPLSPETDEKSKFSMKYIK